MFKWYRSAAICYAYLSDVTDLSELEQSRWFTRGWTLQELVAPKEVLFYSSDWKLLGSKLKISDELCQITNIEKEVLVTGAFHHVSIGKRMSWAASRQTTRIEDLAYCLLGIFDVNMPLLYGEGVKSFHRLQEEILKSSDDPSLFAWALSANIRNGHDFFATQEYGDESKLHGIFAESPAAFTLAHQIQPLGDWETPLEASVKKGGVEVTLPVWESGLHLAAAIPCTFGETHECCLCIPLMRANKGRVARLGELLLIPVSGNNSKWSTQRLFIAPPLPGFMQSPATIKHFDILSMLKPHDIKYTLEVHCLPHAQYSADHGEITLSEIKEGPYAVLFFTKVFEKPGAAKMRLQRQINSSGDIRELEIIEWNSEQPRFAILLGRSNTNYGSGSRDGSWAKFIHVLDENRADKDFYALLARKAELVRCCATRSQILSALQHLENEKSFLCDIREGIARCWIEHQEESFRLDTVSGSLVRSYHGNTRDVFVDVDVQTEWRNFMQRKTVFSMKIYAKDHLWRR